MLAFTLADPPASPSQIPGKEFLPPEHWSYDALERFEALGMVTLPSERPYTRPDIVGYVSDIVAAAEEMSLTRRDRYNLDRLRQEFSSGDAWVDVGSRFDPPILRAEDDPLYLEGDVALSFVPRKDLLETQWGFFVRGDPNVRLHLRDWLTYEVRYQLEFGPERGDRADRGKPSRRERSWRGLTSLYERAYVVHQSRRILLYWGRDYVDWGPGENGNLLVSQTAESLDKLGGRLRFKNLTLSFFHATLSVEAQRRVWGHRLEMRFGDLNVGVSEAVVYAGRDFDPVYALPLISVYGNQFNEKANEDNVLWEFDAKWAIRDGLLLYGSFLIDDYQFERAGEENPDKLAFDAGARVALVSPLATTLRFQYRFADIYTYTHFDSSTYWIAGHGDPALDAPLGASEGPDTDSYFVEATFYPLPSLSAALAFSLRRRGEGNDFRNFQSGDERAPSFPSGIVEKRFGYRAAVEWTLKGNSSLGANVVWTRLENIDHESDRDEWTTAVRVHATWDL